jgi:hypothetical protein
MRPPVEQLQPDLVKGGDAFAESVFYEILHGLISREAREWLASSGHPRRSR